MAGRTPKSDLAKDRLVYEDTYNDLRVLVGSAQYDGAEVVKIAHGYRAWGDEPEDGAWVIELREHEALSLIAALADAIK